MPRTSVVAVGLEDQVMGYHHTVVAGMDQVVEAGMEWAARCTKAHTTGSRLVVEEEGVGIGFVESVEAGAVEMHRTGNCKVWVVG